MKKLQGTLLLAISLLLPSAVLCQEVDKELDGVEIQMQQIIESLLLLESVRNPSWIQPPELSPIEIDRYYHGGNRAREWFSPPEDQLIRWDNELDNGYFDRDGNWYMDEESFDRFIEEVLDRNDFNMEKESAKNAKDFIDGFFMGLTGLIPPLPPEELDSDNDGYSDEEEELIGSDPFDPSDPSGYPVE